MDKLIAQQDIDVGGVKIKMGDVLRPATPEQVARYKAGFFGDASYAQHTSNGMVLIDLDGTSFSWVSPYNYERKIQPKRRLTKVEIDAEKVRLSDALFALYGHPRAEVTVSRIYVGPSKGKPYRARVGVPDRKYVSASGTTELRALRRLYRKMKSSRA